MSTAGKHVVTHQTYTHSLSSQGVNDTETNGGGPLNNELCSPNDRQVVEASVGNVSMGWISWPVATDIYYSDVDWKVLLLQHSWCWSKADTATVWFHKRASHLPALRAFGVIGLIVNKRLGGGQSNPIGLKGGEGWGKQTGLGLIISLSGSELQPVRPGQEGSNWVDSNMTDT